MAVTDAGFRSLIQFYKKTPGPSSEGPGVFGSVATYLLGVTIGHGLQHDLTGAVGQQEAAKNATVAAAIAIFAIFMLSG